MAAAETVVPANRMREEEDLVNNDFIDLMNPRDDLQIGSTDKKEEILPSYDFQPIRPIGSSSPPSKFETGGAGGPRAWNSTDNNSSSPSIRLRFPSSPDSCPAQFNQFRFLLICARTRSKI